MSYTLYIGENCHQCSDVLEFINESNVIIEVINTDLTNQKPPISLFAYPALFEDEILLCYGSDIKNYLSKKIPLSNS